MSRRTRGAEPTPSVVAEWPWRATLGAVADAGGTRFRVWAPGRRRVRVALEDESGRRVGTHVLAAAEEGTFAGRLDGVGAGCRYRYLLDGDGPYPDPASRCQPEGVHGPSQVVDARCFHWAASSWAGLRREDAIVYELHVGTFSPEGTFDGARRRLPFLRDLGVTAVELMPVADFAGRRNWGYDGVALFAPARCYGAPDDLRSLVDAAHGLGLGVFLDVVYNHLGPAGAVHGLFSPQYFSTTHRTPWGAAMNLDGPGSRMVREFFIENALHWLHEYRIDGLRLDATHALIDDGPRHFLAELSARVQAGGRPALLFAEDHRNLAHMVRPREQGGWGLDAVWADDFHHQVRRALAGDDEGYYADFGGSTEDLCATIRRGWFYRGQRSKHLGAPRGTDPAGLTPRRFVVCLQNHDQVGNRAFGDRLHHGVEPAVWRAATVLLLSVPETPLLFMGQEWAAATPFLYFTDHEKELGKLVTRGRRREFRAFSAFADPEARRRIPDPQALQTFLASRLDWSEPEGEPHASVLRLTRAMLRLRRREAALKRDDWDGFDAMPLDDDCLALLRRGRRGSIFLVVVRLRGAGPAEIGLADVRPRTRWRSLLGTEDAALCPDPVPLKVKGRGARVTVDFERPGAVVLKGLPPGGPT